MSFVNATPELLEAASADLADIGASLSSTSALAAAPTVSVAPAGADGVSTAIAELFAWHGQADQQLSAQANTFHNQFVSLMQAGARSYSTVDTANQAALQAEAVVDAAQAALPASGSFAGAPPVALGNAITPVATQVASAASDTPLYAALANSAAFEGLGDWI